MSTDLNTPHRTNAAPRAKTTDDFGRRLPGIGLRPVAAALLCLLATALAAQDAPQQAEAADDRGPRLTVRLAPADTPTERVDAREGSSAVYASESPAAPDRDEEVELATPIGERAALWVRNAGVIGALGTNTFERYYKGKYISRSSELSIPLSSLGVGAQTIDPGGHPFHIAADGRVTSNDPDVIVDGLVVTLKVYPIEFMAARGNESGPPEGRMEPEPFGLYVAPTTSDQDLDSGSTLLSRNGVFAPLLVYLPANIAGAGYVLYPYGQTFHVHPGGRVELTGERLAGLTADGSRMVAEHAVFQGRIATRTGLRAGLGAAVVRGNQFVVRPSHTPLRFTAGFGMPSLSFGLSVAPDITRRPQKYFVADNLGSNPADVRLLAIEMDSYVLTAGETATVSMRFMENTDELRGTDVIDPPPQSSPDADAPATATGWALLLTPLQKHDPATAPTGHPFSTLLRCFETADVSDTVWNALKPLPEENQRQVTDARQQLLIALNLALHDPHFHTPEGFAGIELSAASRAAVVRGIAEMRPQERVRANRGLLADLFPGAFRPFDRTPSIAKPAVRAAWSPYYPKLPTDRVWTPFEILEWQRDEGTLSFAIPELSNGFYHVRFMVVDGAQPAAQATELYGEFPVGVIGAGHSGAASFISPKGRNAFVAGETVRLEAVIRSADARRAAGRPVVVLTHPDGRSERMPFADRGGAWCSQPMELAGETTRHLPPGRYTLSFADLPPGVAPWPSTFDLVGADPRSAYTIIMNDKYAGSIPLNWGSGWASDVDRAARTVAEMGYNRIELAHDFGAGTKRAFTERERIALSDPRLPPPEAVYQPSPRERLLNACVRQGLQFSNTLLGYNDFHLPRRIEPYVRASERWIARDASAMRHSPAFDGIFLYQEMYEWGKMGVTPAHTELWPRIRNEVTTAHFGEPPSAIRNRMGREMRRPRGERDPKALERFLELRRFEIASWGDYNSRLARAAREVAPRARIGTYNQAFLQVTAGLGAVSSGVDMDCGFRPDLFRDLDIRSIIHYQDGPCGGWIHSPMLVQLLRFGPRRPVWINYPVRVVNYMPMPRDGQYQRRMAFAFLAEGADGISLWGLPHSFGDGPNPAMMRGKETTAHLNREILEPFGELVTATDPGYRKVGIVHTENQMILSDFKELRTANQIEELWLACWRMGYPAVFLREDAFAQPLDGLDVIFVPGIRFDGELDDNTMQRLEDAIARGAHVVVERNSTLDLPGIERMDFDFNNYFLGPGYNPGQWEDEIYRIFRYTQPTVDFLAGPLAQWTQPAARGPFSVGPNWRRGGDIHYLIMGNYEMVDYSAALKQVMASPTRMPLTVGKERGGAAYDLLHGTAMPLEPAGDENRLTLDMTRIQGAIVAFLPEAVGGLRTDIALATDGGTLRVGGTLTGASGAAIDGVFPARITLSADGFAPRRFYRAIGGGRVAELQLPGGTATVVWSVEVREAISGLAVAQPVERPAVAGSALRPLAADRAYVPHPDEVSRFWKESRNVLLVVGDRIPGMESVVDELVAALAERNITVTRKAERAALRYSGGGDDVMKEDPLADGFHTWGGYGRGQQPIAPFLAANAPVVLLTSAGGSTILRAIDDSAYLDPLPVGKVGLPAQPTVQRARRALHPDFDTLCLIANDAAGMRHAVRAALGGQADTPPAPLATSPYARARSAADAKLDTAPPPADKVGNNEMVTDLRFDAAGNSYLTTWGHGDNLYSFDPDGAFRFSRYLPEFGPFAVNKDGGNVVNPGGHGSGAEIGSGAAVGVYADRLLACTAVGSRLYQIRLDGTPIWQLRLSRDTGFGEERTPYWPVFHYAEPTRRVVYRDDLNGAMRVIDEDGNLVVNWQGEPYEDPEDPAAGRRRKLHDFAISPDGQRVAQIESTQYKSKQGDAYDSTLAVRELATGRPLANWPKVLANEAHGVSVGVHWRDGDEGPSVTVDGEIVRFDAGLTHIVEQVRVPVSGMFAFGDRGALQRSGSRILRWVDRDGRERVQLDPFEIMPTVAQLSPDGKTLFFLDEYGQASFYDTSTGKRRCTFAVPEMGNVTRFTPDSARLQIGGLRGALLTYDLDGKLLWQRKLGEHNRTLAELKPPDRVRGFPTTTPPPSKIFPDHTEKQWPSLKDEPGQLEALVDLDPNRLINGDAAGDSGWVPDAAAAYAQPGFESPRGLRVGTNIVSQEVSGFIGDHFTWVLEFRYRQAADGAGTRLIAGLRAQSHDASRDPMLVVRHFDADETWRFARIVTKSGAAAKALSVAFRSDAGETLVDDVALRRIRFPSVDHMLHPPIHDVTPRVLASPRFMESYDPLGRLREAIPNRIIIENLHTISQNLVDSAFLQNARLNDVGSDWYIYPQGEGKTDVSLGLREPRWISMVGVYFNAYEEANIAPHYDILVTDLNAKQVRLVASVRNNRQLFRLTTFKPLLADAVTLRLVNPLTRQRTVTEVEIYGPLSGREGVTGFVDAEGQNTYMGNFARVDRRRLELGADIQAGKHGVLDRIGSVDKEKLPIWNYPATQPLVGEDRMHMGRALGYAQSHALNDAVRAGVARVNGLGFGNPGALYGGLWLLPGNDGVLYGVDLASSRMLWSVPLGERLRSGPVAIGNDVMAASDTGRLYALDLGSGALLREATLSAGVVGSLATDGEGLVFVSEDGHLQCWDARTFERRWSVPVAPWTVSTPAIDGGLAYMADSRGVVRAVRMADGQVLWQRDLKDEFTRCPVVAGDALYLGLHSGKLAALARADGALLWETGVGSRFNYEPLPVTLHDDQAEPKRREALLVVNNGKLATVDTADGSVRAWTVRAHTGKKAESTEVGVGDPPASISYYRGALYLIDRSDGGHGAIAIGGPLHQHQTGSAMRLTPAKTETP